MAGVKDEKFLYEDSLKNSIFRGGHEKGIYKGQLPKKGGLGQFFNLRGGGGLGQKVGSVFIIACILCSFYFFEI